MTYPMTWQRLVRRNHLVDGNYTTPPEAWNANVHTSTTVDPHAAMDIIRAQRERLLRYQKQAALLVGDLRRLDADAQDEEAICEHLSQRTGLPRDSVAAVLKEFFAL